MNEILLSSPYEEDKIYLALEKQSFKIRASVNEKYIVREYSLDKQVLAQIYDWLMQVPGGTFHDDYPALELPELDLRLWGYWFEKGEGYFFIDWMPQNTRYEFKAYEQLGVSTDRFKKFFKPFLV